MTTPANKTTNKLPAPKSDFFTKLEEQNKSVKTIKIAKKARAIGLAILGLAIVSALLPIIFIPLAAITGIALGATAISLGAIGASSYIASTLKLNYAKNKSISSAIVDINELLKKCTEKKKAENTSFEIQKEGLDKFTKNQYVIDKTLEIFETELKSTGLEFAAHPLITYEEFTKNNEILYIPEDTLCEHIIDSTTDNIITITQSINCDVKPIPRTNYELLNPNDEANKDIKISYRQKYKLINDQYQLIAIENPKIAFIKKTGFLKLITENHPAYDSFDDDNLDITEEVSFQNNKDTKSIDL